MCSYRTIWCVSFLLLETDSKNWMQGSGGALLAAGWMVATP